jgi:hypothetical protein
MLWVPFYLKISVLLLSWVILRQSIWRFIYGFYLLPNTNPSGPLAPSSHRMRDNPFLGQCQFYQHLDNISMLAILSSKSGSTIFSNIFILTTLFFILMTFSDIFLDVADIFVFRPSAIFCRCRCLQHWSIHPKIPRDKETKGKNDGKW